MKSLEEVIKYKLDFLPIGINPFYAIQTYRARRGSNPTTTTYDIYETKEGIFSNDSFTLVEDITPLLIYISSCDKYYRENGHGKIQCISIILHLTDLKTLNFGDSVTYDNECNELGEHRIAIFKNHLNYKFSRMGYCMRYIKPFTIKMYAEFIHFPALINKYKIFKLEECAICLEKEPKVLFCDCGHICICKKCILNRFDNCPVCKKENTILRIIE